MKFRFEPTQYANTGKAIKQKLSADFIKNSINPGDFYKFELPGAQLRRSAWNDAGLCCFHYDNQAGRFRANLITGAFGCFSCGPKGGDIVAFTMHRYDLNFGEALQKLSSDWGLA
jgi:DNA primase